MAKRIKKDGVNVVNNLTRPLLIEGHYQDIHNQIEKLRDARNNMSRLEALREFDRTYGKLLNIYEIDPDEILLFLQKKDKIEKVSNRKIEKFYDFLAELPKVKEHTAGWQANRFLSLCAE